jgi:DNA mismatch repair protein MutS
MSKATDDTPLLKQYFNIKAQHPEAILLYRVGDFYETYSDDAVLASKVLGLVLTKRSNGEDAEGNKKYTPMAGFPHHAIELYLTKLIRAGYKVAVCDQLEDPKLAVKLVKRGVTELLTPGVAFGEEMLEQKEHNYLAGLDFENNQCGAAFLDVSTGTFQVAQGSIEYIRTLLSSFSPKELVVTRGSERGIPDLFGDGWYVSTVDEWAFVYDSAVERLKKQFGVDSLKGYAVDAYPLGICAAGALMVYLEQTQHAGLKNICSISRIDQSKFVWMDRFTIRNLEIFQSASGSEGVSLVSVIDKCVTPMGARLLRSWLSMPVLDIKELESRYDVVQYFIDHQDVLRALQVNLGAVGDLERIIGRAATGKIGPREILHLVHGLEQIDPIKKACSDTGTAPLDALGKKLIACGPLIDTIKKYIREDAAIALGRGDVIAEGLDPELDRLRNIRDGGANISARWRRRKARGQEYLR